MELKKGERFGGIINSKSLDKYLIRDLVLSCIFFKAGGIIFLPL
jgi:hypothetical protein